MRTATLITLLSLATAANSQLLDRTVNVGGTSRTFKVYLPSGYTNAETVPLVFVFHGLGDDAANMSGSGFSLIADTARFIPVYPQGEQNGFSQNSWNNGTSFLSSSVDDLAFVDKMLDTLRNEFSIDSSRIYSTGFSMGGIMTHRLGCERADVFAAIASGSGTVATTVKSACAPGRAMPVLQIHGTIDGTVPYDGGALPSLELVPSTMEMWINNNGCTTDTLSSVMFPDTQADNITVDHIIFDNCPASTPVELMRMNGADHIWYVGDMVEPFEMWRFFLRFTHPSPHTGINELEDRVNISLYPNPSEDMVKFQFDVKPDLIRVFDVKGAEVTQLNSDQNEWDTSDLEAGIYLISFEYGEDRVVKRLEVR